MANRSNTLFKAALSAMHYSGAGSLIAPFTSGDGVIFMLHHVTPEPQGAFAPNRILKVTPQFLESVVQQVTAAGFDVISLDDVPQRLSGPPHARPFAVFTLDDGYRDNREHAYPIFRKYGVPFTIYVATAYADGNGELWWLALEEALKRLTAVTVEMGDETRTFPLTTATEKDAAFTAIYWWMRAQPEDKTRALVRRLAAQAGLDMAQQCRDLVMTWDEIRDLASDPLVNIAAHTRHHYALGRLMPDDARAEMVESIARIEAELGRPCRHFSYPYGCEISAGEREFALAAELGIMTAVTTRKGLLYRRDANAMTALPRLSLNGDFQDNRYVKVLLSGAPFALMRALGMQSA